MRALHEEWAGGQIAVGIDGPTPADRPDGSDYNQHVPDLEAPVVAEDAFWRRVDDIKRGAE
jgi:hypothetical protein